jgi:hypothetical protein
MDESPARTGLMAVLIVGSLASLGAVAVLIAARPSPAKSSQRDRSATVARRDPAADRGAEAVAALNRPLVERSAAPEPASPTPRPLIDAPEVTRAKEAILRHRWWRVRITGEMVERIVDQITDHGDGFVFFNSRAESGWVGASDLGHSRTPPRSDLACLRLFFLAEDKPAVKPLGRPLNVVFLRPTPLLRYPRLQALQVLQDSLNQPDSAELFRRNDANLDLILRGLQMPDDGGDRGVPTKPMNP